MGQDTGLIHLPQQTQLRKWVGYPRVNLLHIITYKFLQ